MVILKNEKFLITHKVNLVKWEYSFTCATIKNIKSIVPISKTCLKKRLTKISTNKHNKAYI